MACAWKCVLFLYVVLSLLNKSCGTVYFGDILRNLTSLKNLIGIDDPKKQCFDVKSGAISHVLTSDKAVANVLSYDKKNFNHGIGQRVGGYELVDKLDDLGFKHIYLFDDGHTQTNDLYLPSPNLSDSRLTTSIISTYDNVNIEVDRASNKLVPITIQPVEYSRDPYNEFSLQRISQVKVLVNSTCCGNGSFYMKDNIFHGGHGDVWRAYQISQDGVLNQSTTYILKRMSTNLQFIAECAAREIYFGSFFASTSAPVTQLITYFKDSNSTWLVFRDEGVSLQKLLYVISPTSGTSALLEPSKLWKKLRTTVQGNQLMKALIHHLISATAEIHELGIIHRDLKPNNILINTENEVKLIIGDFSSAVSDDILAEGGYGELGPSLKEETLEYSPPESLLSIGDISEVAYDVSFPESYDIWSIGVIFLEMILGSASVFTIDQRSTMLLARKLKADLKKDSKQMQDILSKLAAWSDYCIYDPLKNTVNVDIEEKQLSLFYTRKSKKVSYSLSSSLLLNNCDNTDQLSRAILKRDPLGIGFQNKWGLDLLKRLLKFDPSERISLREALHHAYFTKPYRSAYDDSEYATEKDRDRYDHEFSNLKYHESPQENNPVTSITEEQLKSSYLESLKLLLPSDYQTHESETKPKESTVEVPYDPVDKLVFTCPTCNRTFVGSWHACHRHLKIRSHGISCQYDRDLLPACLSEHAMFPVDSKSGWCDMQGRRRYVEDFHSIFFTDEYKFYGIFDGHFGSRAARFASKRLFNLLDIFLQNPEQAPFKTALNIYDHLVSDEQLARLNPGINWTTIMTIADLSESKSLRSYMVASSLLHAFKIVDQELEEYFSDDDASGSTASALVQFRNFMALGHVGDSRVVLCCDRAGAPVQLTLDHVPYDTEEHRGVYNRGGFVSGNVSVGETLRVNGKLSVTRALGDSTFGSAVSNSPDILIFELPTSNTQLSDSFDRIDGSLSACENYRFKVSKLLISSPSANFQLFVIMASDGLWDVISNSEACDIVCGFLSSLLDEREMEFNISDNLTSLSVHSAMQEAAKLLSQEAYVRGSTDNIGVVTIDLIEG